MTDFDQSMRALDRSLDQAIAEAVTRALATTMEEGLVLDTGTINEMKKLGLTPLGAEERLVLLKAGVPHTKGALPVELRQLLLLLQQQYEVRYFQLINQFGVAQVSDVNSIDWSVDFRRKLSDFVSDTMRDYIAKVRPTGLNAIFANARNTAPNHKLHSHALKTEGCDCCGAARPRGSDLRYCAYCGNQLFSAV